MSDWRDGYESTKPEDANAPHRESWQEWVPPGEMAEAVKARWKNVPVPYPYGTAKNGGRSGGG